jgi:arsenate reductase (thioredoxin)
MNNVKKILFLCTHNAARSQMAEAFVNSRLGDRYEAHSAGSAPTKVHPCAVMVMAELGIDISGQRAKSVSEFEDTLFDYVITLCADAAENCPIFPGGAMYLHQPFNDPVLDSQPMGDKCASFVRVRDQILQWIENTF